jgi:selenocysteine lyase/cysteine desulfurase
LLEEVESNPYVWFTRTYQKKLIEVKHRLSKIMNAKREDFVVVDNSSSAANSIFNSFVFNEQSVIVMLETAYGVIENLIQKNVSKFGVKVKSVPVDVDDIDRLKSDVEACIKKCIENGLSVDLLCLDHIASSPGILIPVCDIANRCNKYEVPILVDGAHALGQVEIDLETFENVGIHYWFTDTHKWFFSPKGSAVLWVRKDKQKGVYPSIDCATIGSKGCTVIRNKNDTLSDFEKRFMYLGTKDYTPWISIGGAIDFIEQMSGGYKHLITRNHTFALAAQQRVACAFKTTCINEHLTASMCNIRLPFVTNQEESREFMEFLMENKTYVVVGEYPTGCFWLRLCIQLFIEETNIEKLINTIEMYKRNLR